MWRNQNALLQRYQGLVGLLLGLAVTPALGQLPTAQLEGLFPAGGAPGTTLEITITGKNLDDTEKLLFSHPEITSEAKMGEPSEFDEGPQKIENVFLVTLGENVLPGRYEIRSLGKYGLSNPRAFVVGSLSEIQEVEPNGGNEIPVWSETQGADGETQRVNPAVELTLPSTINGRSATAADVDWYRFVGAADDRIVLEGFARRIDSRMDLAMTLVAADGQVVGESRRGACGDPVLSATLPGDGEYFVKVHDALFRGGDGYHYRIDGGSLPHLDFIFPPAGTPGTRGQFTVYGCNLPGGQSSDLVIDGCPLEQAKVEIAIPAEMTNRLEFSSLIAPHQGGMDGIDFRLSRNELSSNPLLVTAATAPIVLETANNDRPEQAQPLTLPCEVAGQFYPQRDRDWFTFEAKKDEVWMLDLISQRLGISTDPSLLIQRVEVDGAGEQRIRDIQFVDDVTVQNFRNQSGRHEFDYRTTDPHYRFTAPADGTYRVLVQDGHSSVKSDPRLVYRLAIRRPAPDFRIVAVPGLSSGSLLLRRGGRSVVRVFAFRQDGYDGEIRVACSGLPDGVTSEEIIIGPGNTMGTLILTTASDAPPATSSLTVEALGIVDGAEVTRQARYGSAIEPFQFSSPNANVASVPSRLVDGIQLCVTDYDPTPVLLTIGDGKPLETSRGGRLNVPYRVKRAEGTTGNLSGFAIDFPPQTSVGTVSIGTKDEGEFELRFQAATPPGTYTFFLAGYNQGYRYRHNPEQLEKAKQRQQRIAKILADAQQAVRDTQSAAVKRQTELQSATNAVNLAKPKTQQAQLSVAQVELELKTLRDTLAQKQDAAKANAEDQSLSLQATQAQAAVDQAVTKLQAAKTTAADAEKQEQEAIAKLEVAQEAKAQADKDAQEARDFQQKAQQEKLRVDQLVRQKQSESNPRNINFNAPSNSLTIKVTEYPIKVETLADQVSIKQGEKVEVPIKLSHLYDFKANVNVQTRLPSGVGGITLQTINVPADKAEGKFQISASANAPVGEHLCTIRLQMNFNGQNLTMERPFKLSVTEVKAVP